MDRDFRSRMTAPVRVGDELDVKIEAVGEKGDGIAKKNGFVLFVPGTKEGDEVRVKITRVLRRVGFAEVVGKAPAGESEEKPSEEGEIQEASEGTEEPEEESSEDTEDFGGDLEEER